MKHTRHMGPLLVLAVILSLPLWLQPYSVLGGSMYPTLRDGELFLVDRLSLHVLAPHRGEVIVFKNPYKKDVGDIVVKRVVGLPGETVHVRQDRVVIDRACDASGKPLNPEPAGILPHDGPCQITFASSTLMGGGAEHTNTNESDKFLGREDYFVLGDDRRDSADSRLFGALQKKDFVGRAVLLVYPRLSALWGSVQ